jgi:hypothetical protein
MRFWQAGALGALTAGAVLLGPAAWSALVVPQPADDIVVVALFLGSGEPARGGVSNTQPGTLVTSGAGSSPAPRAGQPTGTPSATAGPSVVEATGRAGPAVRPTERGDGEPTPTTHPRSSSSTPQTVAPTRVVEVDHEEANEYGREPDKDDDG